MICTLKKKLAKVLCGVLMFAQLGTMQAFARPDWPSDTGIEAEAEALRREKRRQRLMAEGGDAEAEFNRLLEEKRKKNEERRKR